MGLPPNHPKLDHVSIESHGFGGNPIVGTPPYTLPYSTCISETDFRKKRGKTTRKKDPSKTLLPRLWDESGKQRRKNEMPCRYKWTTWRRKQLGLWVRTQQICLCMFMLFPCSPARRRQLLIDSPINTEKTMEIGVLLGNHLDSCWIFNTYWRVDLKIETRDWFKQDVDSDRKGHPPKTVCRDSLTKKSVHDLLGY